MAQQNSRDAAPESQGKGKEASSGEPAEVHSDNTAQRRQQDGDARSEPSFANRLATSATNLSRAVLTGHPDAENLRNGIYAKAQSGPSSSSAQNSVSQGRAATYHRVDGVGTGAVPAFSSSRHSTTDGEQQYAGFRAAQPALDSSVQSQMLDEVQPGLTGPANTLHQSHPPGIRSDVEGQEAKDGQQVIDLLDHPGECDGFDTIEDDLQTFTSPDYELSLRKALFGGSGNSAVCNWTPLLDFQPDFLQDGNVAELLQHFGIADPQQARAMWMHSWNDVLTSYTDEVWGDLGSLAREAQREIQEAREQGTMKTVDPSGMHALQRLRQILAHVRGH